MTHAHHEPTHRRPHARRASRPLVAALVVLVVAGTGGLIAAAASDDAPSADEGSGEASRVATPSPRETGLDPSPTTRDSAGGPTFSVGPAAETLVLGDSLALGLYPFLADELTDRRITYTAEVGTGTRWARRALDRVVTIPPVLVVSAGTNDTAQGISTFAAEVAQILEIAGPRTCVVWTTVARPDDLGGDPRTLNDVLKRAAAAADNLLLVDWAQAVEDDPGLLSSDGIHPGSEGMQTRARLVAEAVQTCSPIDPDAPRRSNPVPSGWDQGSGTTDDRQEASTPSPRSGSAVRGPTASQVASPAGSPSTSSAPSVSSTPLVTATPSGATSSSPSPVSSPQPSPTPPG